MYRGSQILTWSCPIRSLLLREAHTPALSEHTSAVLQGVRHAKKTRSKEGLSFPTDAVSCSAQLSVFSLDIDNHHVSKNFVSSRHQPLQVSSSLQSKQVSDPRKWTVAEDSSQNPKNVSSYKDYLTNTTCSQPWRRPWDICQVSVSCTNKTDYNLSQSHLCYRQHLVRFFRLSTHTSPNFSQPQASSLFLQQVRAIHQAAPHMVDVWKDCLSLENETRCRQSLEPNLKLYQVEKERKALSQSQGKNQGRWASVLVSLCTVEGEPAFLFTLRSSTLKGRHKGDVSFAGGKSDPSDRDVVATALREAWEELGINVATERVWGVLKPLRDMSGMTIAPVLANLGPLEKLSFKPNPGEVEEIFTLSLSHLCNPQNCGYTHFRTGDKYGYTLPVFRNGKHRVWGLTAVALTHTLKLIVPP